MLAHFYRTNKWNETLSPNKCAFPYSNTHLHVKFKFSISPWQLFDGCLTFVTPNNTTCHLTRWRAKLSARLLRQVYLVRVPYALPPLQSPSPANWTPPKNSLPWYLNWGSSELHYGNEARSNSFKQVYVIVCCKTKSIITFDLQVLEVWIHAKKYIPQLVNKCLFFWVEEKYYACVYACQTPWRFYSLHTFVVACSFSIGSASPVSFYFCMGINKENQASTIGIAHFFGQKKKIIFISYKQKLPLDVEGITRRFPFFYGCNLFKYCVVLTS